MRKAIWTVAAGLAALLPAAGVLWGGGAVLAAGQVVAIVDDDPDAQKWGYAPATITVPAGTEITFRNDGQQPHTVTAKDKSFDSPMLGNGEEWKFTFANAGEFAYFCKPHPWMKGVVTVTGAAPAPAPTPTTAAPAPAPTPTTAAPAPAPAPAPAKAKAAPPPSSTTTAPAAPAPTTVTTAAPTTETTVAASAPTAPEPAAEAEAAETTAAEPADEPAGEAPDAAQTAAAAEEGEGDGHAVATLSGDDHETSGLAVGVAIGGTVLLLLMAVLSIPGRKKAAPLT